MISDAHAVLDRAGQEDDPLLQEAREDVERPLAAAEVCSTTMGTRFMASWCTGSRSYMGIVSLCDDGDERGVNRPRPPL